MQFLSYLFPQRSHTYGFSPVCWRTWAMSELACVKPFPQIRHRQGFSPKTVRQTRSNKSLKVTVAEGVRNGSDLCGCARVSARPRGQQMLSGSAYKWKASHRCAHAGVSSGCLWTDHGGTLKFLHAHIYILPHPVSMCKSHLRWWTVSHTPYT